MRRANERDALRHSTSAAAERKLLPEHSTAKGTLISSTKRRSGKPLTIKAREVIVFPDTVFVQTIETEDFLYVVIRASRNAK